MFGKQRTGASLSRIEGKVEDPNCGILFDVDGVLGRGENVFKQAVDAFKLLCNSDGTCLTVPVAIVTNACGDKDKKANLLSSWFNVKIIPEQIIQAPTPLVLFKEYYHKKTLIVGQEYIEEIAKELGFTNIVTLEAVKKAYPYLDMVDHKNRIIKDKQLEETNKLDRIETIILFGEPVQWESNLQLIIDLLMTNGKPDEVLNEIPDEHIPVIACNMDLVYMDKAHLPRFGHGAFLLCLEQLYKAITGKKLKYTALLGKPSEITYRYAEHILSTMARRLGQKDPIEHIFFIGDNPGVDILGSNLYNNFVNRFHHLFDNHKFNGDIYIQHLRASVSSARTIPAVENLLPQTARRIDSILVRTGVYKPNVHQICHCHRDFQSARDTILPTFEVDDVSEAIRLILHLVKFYPSLKHTKEAFDNKIEE